MMGDLLVQKYGEFRKIEKEKLGKIILLIQHDYDICEIEVKLLNCPEQIIKLIHDYLDEDIYREDELKLRDHLQGCKECETIFNELKKPIAFLKSASNIQASANFTAIVMDRLSAFSKTPPLD